MKKTTLLLALFLVLGSNRTFGQEYAPNPKNIEISQRFGYILDNGFEKVDLMKVPSIDKSFFNLGNPKLIIFDKNDRTQKNLLSSFTLVAETADGSVKNNVFQNPSPVFTSSCKQYVTALPSNSKITFMEVKLNVTLPVAVQQAPGSKHQLAPGMLPIAFYLFIK